MRQNDHGHGAPSRKERKCELRRCQGDLEDRNGITFTNRNSKTWSSGREEEWHVHKEVMRKPTPIQPSIYTQVLEVWEKE